MTFRDDMYSLLFATSLHDDFRRDCEEKAKRHKANKAEIKREEETAEQDAVDEALASPQQEDEIQGTSHVNVHSYKRPGAVHRGRYAIAANHCELLVKSRSSDARKHHNKFILRMNSLTGKNDDDYSSATNLYPESFSFMEVLCCFRRKKYGVEWMVERKESKEHDTSATIRETEEDFVSLMAESKVLITVLLVFLLQGTLSILVIYEALMGKSVCQWMSICASTDVVVARFICGITMHLKLAPELASAMKNMKYAVNHSWKFKHYRIAFLSGFLQSTMVISVEVINFLNLLLTN